MTDRTPACLVTGFLGSGKTTLLRRLVRTTPPALYLVNEFNPHDIDGALIAQEGADARVTAISGGSIFCRCLVTEFIDRLRDAADRCESAGLAGIIIEASGIADPSVVRQLLEETGLDRRLDLRNVVAVADPGTIHKLLETLPNAAAQIRAANVVIVNKADVFADDTLDATERVVAALNPSARVERAVRCEIAFDPFVAGAKPAPPPVRGEFALCRDPNYATFVILPDPGLPRQALERFAQAAGDDLYRLKGNARIDGRPTHVEFAADRLEITEAAAAESALPPRLVVIAKGPGIERLRDAASALGSIESPPEPQPAPAAATLQVTR